MANTFDIVITGEDKSAAAFAQLAANLDKALAKTTAMQGPVGEVSRLAEQAKAAFVAYGGAMVVDKLLAFDAEVQKTIGGLKSQADALGLTTDQLQAYQAAARANGGSVEELQNVLGHFNVAIGEAVQGNKQAADAFITLGVKVYDAQGKIRPMSDLLTEAAQKLLAIPDPAQRAAVAHDLFGKAGAQLTPILRELAEGSDTLVAKYREMGLVADQEVIDKLDDMSRQADETSKKIEVLWAKFSTPIKVEGLSAITALFERLDRVKLTSATAFLAMLSPGAFAANIAGQMATSTPREAAESEEKRLQAALASTQKTLDAMGPNDARRGFTQNAVDNLKTQLAAASKVVAAWKLATGDGPGTGQLPPIVATGGGFAQPKATGTDRVGDQFAKLTELNRAAQKAYDDYSAAVANGPVSPELQRQIDLTQKIANDQAAITKIAHADPRLSQMLALVASTDTLNAKTAQLKKAQSDADAVDRQYGDGQRGLIELQDKLNLAVSQGGLDTEVAKLALSEYAKTAEQVRLKNIGLKGGFDGLVAGFQSAAEQAARTNDVFAQGGQLYTGVMSLMDQATQQFAQNGTIQFDKLLQSFISMILQMEMRAAASQILGSIGGGGGGLFSFLTGGGGAGATSGGLLDGVFTATMGSPFMFADGGDPPLNVPSWVGEKGPELWVPRTAGTIFNQQQLAGMGGGGMTIVNHFTFGSDVNQATLRTWGDEVVRRSVAAVVDNRRRGGSVKSAFR